MKISTGASRYPTPVGHSYRVYRKERDHKSGEFTTVKGYDLVTGLGSLNGQALIDALLGD